MEQSFTSAEDILALRDEYRKLHAVGEEKLKAFRENQNEQTRTEFNAAMEAEMECVKRIKAIVVRPEPTP